MGDGPLLLPRDHDRKVVEPLTQDHKWDLTSLSMNLPGNIHYLDLCVCVYIMCYAICHFIYIYIYIKVET